MDKEMENTTTDELVDEQEKQKKGDNQQWAQQMLNRINQNLEKLLEQKPEQTMDT